MGIVLDTSVLIEVERNRMDLRALTRRYPNDAFVMSSITAAEILQGLERTQSPVKKAAMQKNLDWLLSRISVEAFELEDARHHARITAHLFMTGNMIGAHDLQIAATALRLEYAVATLNRKDFERVPGLRLVDV